MTSKHDKLMKQCAQYASDALWLAFISIALFPAIIFAAFRGLTWHAIGAVILQVWCYKMAKKQYKESMRLHRQAHVEEDCS